MDIQGVYDIIHKIADGFEKNAVQCLSNHTGIVVMAIQEQIYCGQNGEGNYLSPNYDNDPYFEERGYWYHRAKDYKAWKKAITPPRESRMLGLPPRPENVPNLFIDGTFFSEITATMRGDTLYVSPGQKNGPDIVAKYKESLLDFGDNSVDYFNRNYMMPSIEQFIKKCGYV